MRSRSPEVLLLSVEEKVLLVQDLWDDIADHHAADIPLPEELTAAFERRRANHLQKPASGSSWEEVKERILARHARTPEAPARG